jgi:hypothetical protein
MQFFSRKTEPKGGSAAHTTGTNAIEMLEADHRAVEALFAEFESAEEPEEKVSLAQQICTELTIHAEVEERIFYPAAREALDEDARDLMDEALVEHRSLKSLIAEIDGSSPKDPLFDANVTVLAEYVGHHVREEEHQMFADLRSTELDLDELGGRMEALRSELREAASSEKPRRAGAKPVVQLPKVGSASRSRSRATRTSGRASTKTARKSTSSARGGTSARTSARKTTKSARGSTKARPNASAKGGNAKNARTAVATKAKPARGRATAKGKRGASSASGRSSTR